MTLSFILVSIESRTCCNIYHGKLQGVFWKFWEIALVCDSFMSFQFMRDQQKISPHNIIEKMIRKGDKNLQKDLMQNQFVL